MTSEGRCTMESPHRQKKQIDNIKKYVIQLPVSLEPLVSSKSHCTGSCAPGHSWEDHKTWPPFAYCCRHGQTWAVARGGCFPLLGAGPQRAHHHGGESHA